MIRVLFPASCLLFVRLGCLAAQDLPRDVHVERNLMIEVRDGIRLATDVYRPAENGEPLPGRFPALLHRTPYGKQLETLVDIAVYFAQHGYVVAIQDIRGRYGSEGTFIKYHDYDAPDGYDTVEWVALLPYTNGQVGMWGTSYGAHTQADAAKMAPPSLATVVLNQGGMANAWDHAVRQGGAFELGREMTWAFRQIPLESTDPTVKQLFENEPVADWYSALPLRRGLSPLSVAHDHRSVDTQRQHTHSRWRCRLRPRRPVGKLRDGFSPPLVRPLLEE